MLKRLSTYFLYHFQAAAGSFNYLFSRPLATLITVVIIAITLTLPALFWVLSDNLKQLTLNWQRGGHISLYLAKPLATADENAFLATVQHIAGVSKAALKTPAQGLAELTKQEGMEDIMRHLPENPLPEVVEVQPATWVDNPLKLEQLIERLKALPSIEQAKLDSQWITRLHAIANFVSKITHALMTLLALALVLIIGNTLRLALHHRQEEIQVLKLIGATDAYILRPFLYAGIWYGLIGAVLAVLFVNIFMLSIAVAVQELASVYHMHFPLLSLSVKEAYLILFAAICLGWLAAKLFVQGQLSSIEPHG